MTTDQNFAKQFLAEHMPPAKKRTPRQRAISYVATCRAVDVARERHIRLENARIAKLEAEYFEKWLAR